MNKIKECSVKLVSLENILFPSKHTRKPSKYFTRSCSAPPAPRTGRILHSASTGVSYEDTPLPDKSVNKPTCAKPVSKPGKDGPMGDQV